MRTSIFLLLLSLVMRLEAQPVDILLKGGHVIDLKNNVDGIMDVSITGNTITAIAPRIDAPTAKKTIDVAGLYVVPGLIDMHVHVFAGNEPDSYIANGNTSLAPDGFTFRSGVTTVVDAGSAGWRNFPQFKKQTIDRAQTRVLALLNISGTGMASRFEEQNVGDMDPQQTAYMIQKLFPDIIVGIKAAHYWGDFTKVDRAVEAGKLAHVPVMVDFGEHDPPNSIEELFMKHLRPGDIFTHTYSYGPQVRETVVDESLKVKPFVFEAQKRGIIFDVGHGGGAFSFRQAIPAMQQGFWPDVISTDLHAESMNGGMKDLNNVMSKFLSMGMPFNEVIRRVTTKPAQVISRTELGTLNIGGTADITVLKLENGEFGYMDIRRMKITGKQKIVTELTIRNGKIVWDLNGLSAPMWNTEISGKK